MTDDKSHFIMAVRYSSTEESLSLTTATTPLLTYYYGNTHTQPVNGPLSGTTCIRVSWHQKEPSSIHAHEEEGYGNIQCTINVTVHQAIGRGAQHLSTMLQLSQTFITRQDLQYTDITMSVTLLETTYPVTTTMALISADSQKHRYLIVSNNLIRPNLQGMYRCKEQGFTSHSTQNRSFWRQVFLANLLARY